MEHNVQRADNRQAVGSLRRLAGSFRLSLEAGNKSPRTVTTYLESVDQLAAFLDEHGMPADVASIRREHVESFIVGLLNAGRSPSTVSIRFRSLQQFFKWCEAEGEVPASPMLRMDRPRVPEDPPPVLRSEQMVALLKALGRYGASAAAERAIAAHRRLSPGDRL